MVIIWVLFRNFRGVGTLSCVKFSQCQLLLCQLVTVATSLDTFSLPAAEFYEALIQGVPKKKKTFGVPCQGFYVNFKFWLYFDSFKADFYLFGLKKNNVYQKEPVFFHFKNYFFIFQAIFSAYRYQNYIKIYVSRLKFNQDAHFTLFHPLNGQY